MSDGGNLVEVLRGGEPDGLTWRVLAGGDDHNFETYIDRRVGDAHAMSGFHGPALYPGQIINSWTGSADGLPPFVLVRATPSVVGVTAIGESGHQYPLTLTAAIERFGLRLGAAPLQQGDALAELRLVTEQTDA